MRSHRFTNSQLHLVIQLLTKESKAKENNIGIRCLIIGAEADGGPGAEHPQETICREMLPSCRNFCDSNY